MSDLTSLILYKPPARRRTDDGCGGQPSLTQSHRACASGGAGGGIEYLGLPITLKNWKRLRKNTLAWSSAVIEDHLFV